MKNDTSDGHCTLAALGSLLWLLHLSPFSSFGLSKLIENIEELRWTVDWGDGNGPSLVALGSKVMSWRASLCRVSYNTLYDVRWIF